jgi:DNA polymerase V
MAIIGHLDADCFYVSAERIRRPSLNRIPVGVLGNQGACVIAKSYEMKAAGVKTGVPIWEAVKLCPEGVYIKRDFAWYEVVSRQMLDAVREQSPEVQYYSIDEFFFEASKLDPHALQQHILQAVGVPVTIGLSRSRSLAKLASDKGKPFGCATLLDDQAISDYVESIDVQEVTGIAARSATKLAEHGIRTIGEFRRADRKLVNLLLTKTGEALWWELNGHAITPIETSRPMHKAIGRGGSIGAATDDPVLQTAWLVRNVERLVEAMAWHGYRSEQDTLKAFIEACCDVRDNSNFKVQSSKLFKAFEVWAKDNGEEQPNLKLFGTRMKTEYRSTKPEGRVWYHNISLKPDWENRLQASQRSGRGNTDGRWDEGENEVFRPGE